jgi:hypothetical protein
LRSTYLWSVQIDYGSRLGKQSRLNQASLKP